MPRRGVSLTRAINQEDLVGGGTTNTTSVPGRETAVAKPQISDAAKAAQQQIDQASAMPTIVIPEEPSSWAGLAGDTSPASGGDAVGSGDEGEGGSGEGSGGGDAGGGAGVEAAGGLIKGSSAEHPITAQAGEFVMQKSAVAKYGLAFMQAINAGRAPVVKHSEAVAHFAKGRLVGSARRLATARLAHGGH